DEEIRRSLQGAVAAIGEQKKQRGLLKLGAERLDAEQLRLQYVLERLLAQFVRLRMAGAGAQAGPDRELEGAVAQLGTEIDAVADALEEVARSDALAAVAEG